MVHADLKCRVHHDPYFTGATLLHDYDFPRKGTGKGANDTDDADDTDDDDDDDVASQVLAFEQHFNNKSPGNASRYQANNLHCSTTYLSDGYRGMLLAAALANCGLTRHQIRSIAPAISEVQRACQDMFCHACAGDGCTFASLAKRDVLPRMDSAHTAGTDDDYCDGDACVSCVVRVGGLLPASPAAPLILQALLPDIASAHSMNYLMPVEDRYSVHFVVLSVLKQQPVSPYGTPAIPHKAPISRTSPPPLAVLNYDMPAWNAVASMLRHGCGIEMQAWPYAHAPSASTSSAAPFAVELDKAAVTSHYTLLRFVDGTS